MAVDLEVNGSEGKVTSVKERALKNGDVPGGEKKKSKKDDDDPSKQEIRNAMRLAMDKNKFSLWPEFPKLFRAMEDEMGERRPIIITKDKVCSYYSFNGLRSAIMQYAAKELNPAGINLDMPESTARDFANYWLSTTEPIKIEEIETIAPKNQDVLCWQRLKFDLDFDEWAETPTFDELFSRISNANALKAFIGSLFFKEADRQQYVWLYGGGNTGKSSLAEFLRAIFGKACIDTRVDKNPNQFWTSTLGDARLVLLAECENYDFIRSGLFKSLTGNDGVPMERKGEPVFTGRLFSKFLFYSNQKPGLGSSMADQRRVIYCTVQDLPKGFKKIPEKTYHKKLMEEAPAFLGECVTLYKLLCPDHGEIPTEHEFMDELISSNEEAMETFFDGFLEANEDEYFLPRDLQNRFEQAGIRNPRVQREYKNYMERTLGTTKKQISIKNEKNVLVKTWVYAGAKIKDKPAPQNSNASQGNFYD